MKFWSMHLYPDIFNFLIVFASELGSKDLNGYKNSTAYSYHKSGWLEPLLHHDLLTGSNFSVLKDECRKSQSVHDPFHKLWIILEKSAKVQSCHCSCIVGTSKTSNQVAATIFWVEAAVRTGSTNTFCTSFANEWLPCRKDKEDPQKLKI